MFPLNFCRCARKRTVSEQPILVPEHCNWAIFENTKFRAKRVAAILKGQRGLLYDFDALFLPEIVVYGSPKISVSSTKCFYIWRPFPNSC